MSTTTAPAPAQTGAFTLKNVRLSYPALFEPKAFDSSDANSKPKFQATFLLDNVKNADVLKQIHDAMKALMAEKKKTLAPSKLGLRSGTEKPDTDGYSADMHFLTSSSDRKPRVVDRDRTDMSPTDARLFAGCYVNAAVRMWWQDNKFGQRVNFSLEAVQYVGPGDPFGAPAVDVNSTFDAIPDTDEII